MKKILLITLLVLGCLWGFDVLAQNWSFSCSGNNCFKAGVDAAGNTIGKSSGVITGKSITEAVQDIIKYFLTFLSLIAVVYVMYAGAQMLLNPGSEESGEKTKKIILSVIIGTAIIWFAWWIVSTLFYVLNNDAVASRFIPKAVAEAQIRMVDFTTYRNNILALKTKITGTYNPAIMDELTILVDGTYDHLPDRADMYANQQLYDRVKTAIANYNLHREEIDLGQLQNALDAYLEQSKTFSIQGQVSAAPNSGDAPLSVTLEGKNIIDGSGTLIPEGNYTWWVRTPEGSKILGRGKTINYIFTEEGTYTVNLTVNSASKNSKGFNDVINFEDQVTVDVGQPKARFIIFFNDQIASDTIKIPQKEAEQEIIIDARQTRFSSGYTISKTEWEFGNGITDSNDGGPLIEFQKYKQGEHQIKLKLTRNDGEVFEKKILLKVGDPVASMTVSKTNPNKGEKVTFQAKKSNQENVQFSWEIKKEGMETVLYAMNGPRAEYVFREIGNYAVSLVSTKGESRDKETVQIYVDSLAPVVRFDSQPQSTETPNIYLFDGTATYDPDFADESGLKYKWFINNQPLILSETNSNNSKGTYTFPEKGTYQVELQVTDNEGKMGSFKKAITIKNVLSIQLNMRPQIAQRGQRILLSASAPDAQVYEWTIPGFDTVAKETGRHIVSFEKSGTYLVTLKVTNKDGETNTVKRKIYIANGDQPFAVLDVSSKSIASEIENEACDGQDALIVDRVSPVALTGDKSVNVGGQTAELTYFWQVGLNKTSTQKNLSYSFDELGCEQISLTVTDKKTGTSHTSAEWVKVINIAPRFSDIDVAVENIDMDPMKVNLRLQGARDPDGVIRSYTWYYATSPESDDPLGFRITTKPETSFVLPKVTGRYYFSVIMEDSNGLRVDTKNISDGKFSTPDLLVNQNLAAPIVEFIINNKEIAYGEDVVFSANVKNALEKDIAADAEYRWDVDGDGFYDIKTDIPTYTFKYTNPGTYKPKVKVTHKGISATKSDTITVTNRLVPSLDIQVIGDKIIAYNTSSGIFQSAVWFADDKKISENKEYLYYESTDKFPSNLKIQITDGKQTEEKIYTVERKPANKILVRQIENPLVLLSNSENVAEVSDNITWTDPQKPLYLYMGESTASTKYYSIDTDIEIDTDLSGGKDDDADNKGTASYRLGRPFQIPVGTKRATIMKLRILEEDGTELGSRQIRVTREFIAPADLVDTTTENIEGPKQFNLSAADKSRLEKLQNLIKNAPEEEKKTFGRYIDQLGDIWYDRADRAETLLQFANAIEQNSTISPDLKERLLTQINLIYTEGEQEVGEKVLARKVMTDLLDKSPYKKEIFGEEVGKGLIDEIIDNPEYYDKNMSIAARIYDEYVAIDTTLSAEAKAVIKEKLTTLIGEPLDKTATNGDGDVDEAPAATDSNLMGYIRKYGLLAGGIIAVVLGIMVLLALFRRGQSQTATPIIEKSTVANTNEVLTPTTKSDENVPDWLKESDSPFGGEDVLAQSSLTPAPTNHTDEDVPEWAKTPEVSAEVSVVSEEVEHKNDLPQSDDVPDWLKGLHDEPEANQESDQITPQSENIEESAIEANKANSNEGIETPTVKDDAEIPEWLRGAEEATTVETTTPEKSEENEAKDSNIFDQPIETSLASDTGTSLEETSKSDDVPDWLKGTEDDTKTNTESINTNEVSLQSAETVSVDDTDIPEWLRGAEEATPVETATSEKSEENEAKDSNIFDQPIETGVISTLENEGENSADTDKTTQSTVSEQEVKTVKTKKEKWKNPTHWKKGKSAKKTEGEKVPEKTPKKSNKVKLLEPAHDLIEPAKELIEPAKDVTKSN